MNGKTKLYEIFLEKKPNISSEKHYDYDIRDRQPLS